MKSIGWNNCAQETQDQVRRLQDELRGRLGEYLEGVYLHGSLAMGCFSARTSDIDLLAVVGRTIIPERKKALAELFLTLSGSPHPIEISFLRPEDMSPWRHPAPYEFHFSEEGRERCERDLASGVWREWNSGSRTDPDLAAHITVLRARGIGLSGKPIADVFPAIPSRDYLAALVADLEWAEDRTSFDLVYGILNACRVYAYVRDGGVYSKAEGAAYGLMALPAEFHPAIEAALSVYEDRRPDAGAVEPGAAHRLLNYVLSKAKGTR